MNPKKLIKSVKALTGWRETAFLLALVERNVVNAELFLSATERLNIDAERFHNGFDSVLDESWDHAVLRPNEERLVECLDEVIGHIIEEDIDSYGVIPCNQCLLLWELALVSSLNRDKKRAEEGSQLSINVVSGFLEFSEGDDLDENALIKLFEKHELMLREMEFQQALCDLLRSTEKLNKELMTKVRGLAFDGGVSNLGISLED